MSFFRRKLRPAVPSGLALRADPRVDRSFEPPAPPWPASPRLAEPASLRPASAPEGSDPEDARGALRVLVVCTANICRSPLGEALLGRALRGAGLSATVRSAGVNAADLPVDPRSAAHAAASGGTLADHRPRQLTESVLRDDGRELVLAMTREHVREIAMLDPDAMRRTFTLREFVRRATAEPAMPGESLAVWIHRLSASRRMQDLLGDGSDDDVPDPYGRSDAMFREVAAEIDRLSNSTAQLLGGLG